MRIYFSQCSGELWGPHRPLSSGYGGEALSPVVEQSVHEAGQTNFQVEQRVMKIWICATRTPHTFRVW